MTGTTPVYLDYNATAPLHPRAVDAMAFWANIPANPSSVHHFGRAARAKMDSARAQIAQFIGANVHEVVFTSGGTESNNLVLSNYTHIITSAIEHDAVLAACPDAVIVGVDEQGLVCLSQLEAALQSVPEEARAATLVSVMAANNETGVIQPLQAIAELSQKYHIACHSDMIQFLGKSPIDLAHSGLDFASFSAHKIGGPSGVGALWCRAGKPVTSLLRGGGQEQGRRAGTENMPGITGFAAALLGYDAGLIHSQEDWRDTAEAIIKAACPDIEVMGNKAPRLANTSALYLPEMAAQTAVMMLDLAGYAVSAGSACSSGKVKQSHVIAAMGHQKAAGNVIRISGGWQTTQEDWQRVAEALIAIYKRNTN